MNARTFAENLRPRWTTHKSNLAHACIDADLEEAKVFVRKELPSCGYVLTEVIAAYLHKTSEVSPAPTDAGVLVDAEEWSQVCDLRDSLDARCAELEIENNQLRQALATAPTDAGVLQQQLQALAYEWSGDTVAAGYLPTHERHIRQVQALAATPAAGGDATELRELPKQFADAFLMLTRDDSTPQEVEARMFLMRHITIEQSRVQDNGAEVSNGKVYLC